MCWYLGVDEVGEGYGWLGDVDGFLGGASAAGRTCRPVGAEVI